MIETITAMITTKVLGYAAGTIGAVILAWILKRIPNEKISNFVENVFHELGKWITLTASKRSKLWNKIVEPWVIDLIDNTINAALRGLIKGLRSDD